MACSASGVTPASTASALFACAMPAVSAGICARVTSVELRACSTSSDVVSPACARHSVICCVSSWLARLSRAMAIRSSSAVHVMYCAAASAAIDTCTSASDTTAARVSASAAATPARVPPNTSGSQLASKPAA